MKAWDVYLEGKKVDTVFYQYGIDADEVRRGLVDHDGVDPRIQVRAAPVGTLHKNLTLITLDPESHGRTCGYWYVIQENHGPHTAFARRDHLIAWLAMVGLEMTEDMPEHGKHSYQRLEGEYRTAMHWSYDDFFALDGQRTRTLSNGQYTVGIITAEDDGVMTVNTLNPNCKDRPIFDYFESRALYG